MADSKNLLAQKQTRRLFFISCSLGLFVLIGIRYFAIPIFWPNIEIDFVKTTILLIDQLIITLISVISVSLVILWLNPPAPIESVVEVINPQKLLNIYDDAFEGIEEFRYTGHTARWTRSITFPRLAEHAKKNRKSVLIYIIILNPKANGSSLENAKFQKRMTETGDDLYSIVKNNNIELYATIVNAYSWAEQHPLMKIHVALTDKNSLFRTDIYSKFALVTQADPRAPALKYIRGTTLFDAIREEAIIKFEQSEELNNSIEGIPFTNLTNENVKQLLIKLGFEVSGLTDLDFGKIIEIAKAPVNPFKR